MFERIFNFLAKYVKVVWEAIKKGVTAALGAATKATGMSAAKLLIIAGGTVVVGVGLFFIGRYLYRLFRYKLKKADPLTQGLALDCSKHRAKAKKAMEKDTARRASSKLLDVQLNDFTRKKQKKQMPLEYIYGKTEKEIREEDEPLFCKIQREIKNGNMSIPQYKEDDEEGARRELDEQFRRSLERMNAREKVKMQKKQEQAYQRELMRKDLTKKEKMKLAGKHNELVSKRKFDEYKTRIAKKPSDKDIFFAYHKDRERYVARWAKKGKDIPFIEYIRDMPSDEYKLFGQSEDEIYFDMRKTIQPYLDAANLTYNEAHDISDDLPYLTVFDFHTPFAAYAFTLTSDPDLIVRILLSSKYIEETLPKAELDAQRVKIVRKYGDVFRSDPKLLLEIADEYSDIYEACEYTDDLLENF